MFHQSLRDLFLHDACLHSGIYDSLQWVTCEDGIEPVKGFRGQIQAYARDEAALSRQLCRLLVAAADEPKKLEFGRLAAALKRQAGWKIVMSSVTLEREFQIPYDSFWRDMTHFRSRLPSKLVTRMGIIHKSECWIHPDVQLNTVLVINPNASEVGVLSTPQYFPYPAGAGIFKDSGCWAAELTV